ncbi:hypothetical protein EJ419_07045 [Alloscardovia theropitheci]|uniref:SAF domain-containing protein n=1 Tax=Alloscardovia theropitheci TaxID=2496842 RepID=A0A4R0QQV8_9BIFI|nr:SAF domain-containing protein [Alloscardovia theropitheci]TCD53718.1 hypothetical protein EJ419_07045 [Alloscardovia theropitheci]
MLLTLSVLRHRHEEVYIVQTTHTIPRGMIIKDSDLRLVTVSSSLDTSAMVTSVHMVSGKLSPITLTQGSFIPQSVIEDVPIVPHGYTSLDVTLASSASSIKIGETISLLTSEETLSSSAVVLHIPQQHRPQQIWDTQNSETSAITLALPAHDAMKVLTAQNNSPIIAVPLSKETGR